jgi:hypothetical protein
LPSLDDLDSATDSGDVTDTAPSDDVLAAVKAEGGRRRARRHRRNAAFALLGLVVLAVPALALLPDGDGDQQLTVAADDEEPSTSTSEAPRTTVSTTTSTTVATETTIVVAPPETATTTLGTRPTSAPTTTVPRLVCRNSTDPACGAFRWDPQPANAPMNASFASAPSQAVVGEAVTFVVDWTDADANAIDGYFSPDGVGLGAPCQYPQGYGPWTPPAAAPGAGSWTYTHTFTAPGDYVVAVSLWTGDVCGNPYASDWHQQTPITVTEPEAPPSG